MDDYKKLYGELFEVKKEKAEIKETKHTSGVQQFYKAYINTANNFIQEQPLYYDQSKIWWLWNFKEYKWEMIDETDLMNMFDGSEQSGYIDTVKSNTRIEIIEALKRVARKNKPQDGKKTWVQFKNKIVDIKTGEQFIATYKYFITNPIPYEIGNSEETPVMDKIFEEWVGKDYVQTLYEIIAYSTLPNYPIHRLFCLIGEGLNGKSCYLRLLKKFVGIKNVTSTELDVLLNSRFEIARLHKKLVCMLGETDFAEINKTSIIKKLTGQDLIGYEYKNKNPFEDMNYAKILIATNNLPTTSDKTIGFYRRWCIIDFINKFDESVDILNNIPEREYNNLSLKSIKILKELLKNRVFYNEGSVEDRIKKYEEKSNPFDKFWKECIDEDMDSFIFKKEFKDKLDSWCIANRFRKLSDIFISKHMKEKGVKDGKFQADWYTKEGEKPRFNGWEGIKWK